MAPSCIEYEELSLVFPGPIKVRGWITFQPATLMNESVANYFRDADYFDLDHSNCMHRHLRCSEADILLERSTVVAVMIQRRITPARFCYPSQTGIGELWNPGPDHRNIATSEQCDALRVEQVPRTETVPHIETDPRTRRLP